MSLIEGLTAELNHEVASTRNLFTRIGDEHFDFKPHERSMPMGRLTAHTIETLAWAGNILGSDVFEFNPEAYQPADAANQAELLALTDSNLKTALDALNNMEEHALFSEWKMQMGDKTVMQGMPKIAVFRSFVLSHMIHHRGQLTVYMRLCEIPIPKVYGPTADDPEMDFMD